MKKFLTNLWNIDNSPSYENVPPCTELRLSILPSSDLLKNVRMRGGWVAQIETSQSYRMMLDQKGLVATVRPHFAKLMTRGLTYFNTVFIESKRK